VSCLFCVQFYTNFLSSFWLGLCVLCRIRYLKVWKLIKLQTGLGVARRFFSVFVSLKIHDVWFETWHEDDNGGGGGDGSRVFVNGVSETEEVKK
jgi:hypothetical protein